MNKAPKEKIAAPGKKAAAPKSTGKKTRPAKKPPSPKKTTIARRSDYGSPIDDFFAQQSTELRAILDALRELVEEAAPDASASLKWGKPSYSIGPVLMCVLAGHKSHVNLVLAGPPGTYPDPEGRLEGEGKTGCRLTLRSVNGLPRNAVRGWLRTAATLARAKR